MLKFLNSFILKFYFIYLFYLTPRFKLLALILIYLLLFISNPTVAECAGISGEGSLDGSAVSQWLNQGGSSEPSALQDDAGTSALAPHPSHEELEIPTPEGPLITLEDRRRELTAELDRRVAAGLTAPLTPGQKRNLIKLQLKIELLLEKELKKKGFSAAILHSNRRVWRYAAFRGGTREHFLSAQSLQRTVFLYEEDFGKSLLFRRVLQSLEWGGCKP